MVRHVLNVIFILHNVCVDFGQPDVGKDEVPVEFCALRRTRCRRAAAAAAAAAARPTG
jgi:hypothetical protein